MTPHIVYPLYACAYPSELLTDDDDDDGLRQNSINASRISSALGRSEGLLDQPDMT